SGAGVKDYESRRVGGRKRSVRATERALTSPHGPLVGRRARVVGVADASAVATALVARRAFRNFSGHARSLLRQKVPQNPASWPMDRPLATVRLPLGYHERRVTSERTARHDRG